MGLQFYRFEELLRRARKYLVFLVIFLAFVLMAARACSVPLEKYCAGEFRRAQKARREVEQFRHEYPQGNETQGGGVVPEGVDGRTDQQIEIDQLHVGTEKSKPTEKLGGDIAI